MFFGYPYFPDRNSDKNGVLPHAYSLGRFYLFLMGFWTYNSNVIGYVKLLK